MPEASCCLRLGAYRMEILQVKDNTVRNVRVLPPAPTAL
jgi:Putative Mg2+ and Co2+ transporter CorB